MRGKVGQTTVAALVHGITPADAGKSYRLGYSNGKAEDHPRECGEKYIYWVMTADSSRITPASAGKRALADVQHVGRRDHPRECGEKARTLIVQDEPQGSPPRVRGKA